MHSAVRLARARADSLSQPLDRGGDALVGDGQRDPHVPGTARAVEVAGRHQYAQGGKPGDAVVARLTPGGPKIEAGVGMVDGKTGRAKRRQESVPPPFVPLALQALV